MTGTGVTIGFGFMMDWCALAEHLGALNSAGVSAACTADKACFALLGRLHSEI